MKVTLIKSCASYFFEKYFVRNYTKLAKIVFIDVWLKDFKNIQIRLSCFKRPGISKKN